MKISSTALQSQTQLRNAPNKGSKESTNEQHSDLIKPWSKLPQPSSLPSFGGFWRSSKSHKGSSSQSSSSATNEGFRLYHVPHISQGNDKMGCWYACVRMLGGSIDSAPRLGLPELFTPEANGLQHRRDVLRLMENEGLGEVPLPSNQKFTLDQLGNLLYRHGPIMFGWQVPNGSYHMSVLTGTDKVNDRVIFHDPRQGEDITMPLDYFNQKLAWGVPHAMMYKK